MFAHLHAKHWDVMQNIIDSIVTAQTGGAYIMFVLLHRQHNHTQH